MVTCWAAARCSSRALSMGLEDPKLLVLDLTQLGLGHIRESDGSVVIGAGATYATLGASEVLRSRLPLLAAMVAEVTGGPGLWNLANARRRSLLRQSRCRWAGLPGGFECGVLPCLHAGQPTRSGGTLFPGPVQDRTAGRRVSSPTSSCPRRRPRAGSHTSS